MGSIVVVSVYMLCGLILEQRAAEHENELHPIQIFNYNHICYAGHYDLCWWIEYLQG